MPNPALIGVAVYTAWKLGYFDSWWDSTKPPTPEDLNPEILRDVLAKYGNGGSPGPTYPEMPDFMREERMLNEDWIDTCCAKWGHKECCDIKKEREGRSREMGPFKPPFDVDRDLDLMESNKKYRNMKLTRVKSLIKEQIRRLNEQAEPTPAAPKPAFYNNMERVFASKGCKGLMKKQDIFRIKQQRVQQRTGAGASNWSDMLQLKIDHITTMMSQMGCDDDTPTMV